MNADQSSSVNHFLACSGSKCTNETLAAQLFILASSCTAVGNDHAKTGNRPLEQEMSFDWLEALGRGSE
jgi:hypothetical protein